MPERAHRLRILFAFACIWFIWGSDLTGILLPWYQEIRSWISLMRMSRSQESIREDAG